MSTESKYKESYELTKKYGTSYFYSALLLNKKSRQHIYALYSLCRHADDMVDVINGEPGMSETALADLEKFHVDIKTAIENGIDSNNLVGAVSQTWNELELPIEYLERFFQSMEMDCSVSSYDTFDDLLVYMDGSAAVIGEMVLPILQPDKSLHIKYIENARALGNAFQLTNFLRDIGEDLQRGRIYVPLKDFAEFGIDPNNIVYDEAFVRLMKFEENRNRELYSQAYPGVVALNGRNGACARTAYRLYGGILDEIRRNGYNTLAMRARLSGSKKIRTCFREFLRFNSQSMSRDRFF